MTTATTTTIEVKEQKNFDDLLLKVHLNNPSLEQIKEAIKAIREYPKFKQTHDNFKFNVQFSEEIRVRRDRYNEPLLESMTVKFFESDGSLCYTFHSRSGYYLSYIDFKKIINISFSIPLDDEKDKKDKITKILNRRYDSNTWSNLNYDSVKYNEKTIINIKPKFPSYVIEQLKEAFEHKINYSYTKYGTKRDLSVQTKLCDDGIFRAWFSSEYSGCGNGQYYLLLNPTTASFCEWD